MKPYNILTWKHVDVEVGVLKRMITVAPELYTLNTHIAAKRIVVSGAFGKLGHGNRLAQSTPKVVVALQGGTKLIAALKSNSTLVNCWW